MVFDFEIEYSEEKNELLKRTRTVCFDNVVDALKNNGFITVIEHRNKKRYPNQKVLVVRIEQYIYAVPYVFDKKRNVVFLKTMYPDRKLTKSYLNK